MFWKEKDCWEMDKEEWEMALLRVNYLCRALSMQMDVSVIIPEDLGRPLAKGICDERYPVLWLLHGGGGDHTDWQRYTSVERYADKAGLAVVMPGVDNSGYMDMKRGGYAYFTYLTEDLPSFLRSILPLSVKREDNFVAGLSMGGYGAVKWMLQRPDMFAACASLSGAIDMVYLLRQSEAGEHKGPDQRAAFGSSTEIEGTEDDNMFMFEKRLGEGVKLPKLYVACGQEDIAHPQNAQAVERLRAMGVEFDYIEDHGEHNWDYWDRHIEKVIAWLPRV